MFVLFVCFCSWGNIMGKAWRGCGGRGHRFVGGGGGGGGSFPCTPLGLILNEIRA